jgi:capsid assembly protease
MRTRPDLALVAHLSREPWPMEPVLLRGLLADITHGAAPRTAAPAMERKRLVAVVPIWGVITPKGDDWFGGTSANALTATFRALRDDASISAVVLDVDSPGGVVTGVPEAAAALRELAGAKRVTAVSNGMMASAAYWIASGANEIVSTPSSSTGSIGVWMAHVDLSKALEEAGITVTILSAGKHKVDGNPYQPLSDDARAALQEQIERTYDWFVADVAAGRGVKASEVKAGFGQGRVLVGKDAKAAGLVDRVDVLDNVLAKLTGTRGLTGRAAAMAADVAERDLPPAA